MLCYFPYLTSGTNTTPLHTSPPPRDVRGAAETAARRQRVRREHLPGIDALRLAAAMTLVCYHVAVTGLAERHLPALGAFARPAALGPSVTSLFIVLSGFVLTYASVDVHGALTSPARDFWRRRAATLAPLLVIGHLLTVPLGVLGSSAYAPGEAVLRGVLALTALQAWVPSLAHSYDVPLWTLSVLAACFAAFPALVRALGGLSRRRATLAIPLVWLGMLAVTSGAYAARARGLLPVDEVTLERMLQTFPPLRFGEFLVGVLLARVRGAGRGDAPPPSLLLLGAVVGAAALLPWTWRLPVRVVATGGLLPAFCLVVWAAAAVPPFRDWRAASLAASLGRATFPVYALHFPLISWLNVVLHRGWLGAVDGLALAIALVATVPMGVAADRWLVQPVARRILGRARRARPGTPDDRSPPG